MGGPPRGGFGGGPGGFGGGAPEGEEEGGWDDTRAPRRTEPKKHRERKERDTERRAAKGATERPKRTSGQSWRQWDMDEADDGEGEGE